MCNTATYLESVSDDQERIFFWIKETLQLPIFADVYLGAVWFLEYKPPGYITFVSHAGRDLMNRLATTFLNIESGQVQYHQLTKKIHACWHPLADHSKSLDKIGQFLQKEKEDEVVISKDLFLAVQKLIRDHSEGTERAKRQDLYFFKAFLDYEEIDLTPKNFISEWMKARKFFLRKTHLSKTRVDEDHDAVKLDEHFRLLESLLLVAAKSQYERIKELDEILDETNI